MKSTKNIGRLMMVLAWIIVIVLLAIYFNRYTARQYNPNQSLSGAVNAAGAKEIVLKRNRNNHYVFRGKINGMDVIFFVDTGATSVTIPEPIAKKLGLQKGFPQYVQTANGTVKAYSTSLQSLTMGNIQLFNVNAIINPGMGGNDILLGMSALKNLQLQQVNGELRIIDINT
jgi:aspartyl protease family protein